jgi:uncharacterized membrane protein YdjX (TVP38/TMEM64 family)
MPIKSGLAFHVVLHPLSSRFIPPTNRRWTNLGLSERAAEPEAAFAKFSSEYNTLDVDVDSVVKQKRPSWMELGSTGLTKTNDDRRSEPLQVSDLRKNKMENISNESFLNSKNLSLSLLFAVFLAITSSSEVSTFGTQGLEDAVSFVQGIFSNPSGMISSVVESVRDMGPLGIVYFGIFYMLAELLAIPATPLTMSAGYLFGMTHGVGVVLVAATLAASISFFVGKTFLRNWVESILQEQPKFAKLDKAVGEQGFKLLLLVRLSPIFPFALSNYVYGASSIDFASYFWATLLGFAPGTVAYVYTGMVGKELLSGDGSQPWYYYAIGATVLAGFLKLVTDVASGIVQAIEDDNENDKGSTVTP